MRRKQPDENLSCTRVKRGRAILIGYGLDDNGGHIRYTRGKAVELFGGSEDAHCEMQRRAEAIQDEIASHGICLDRMTYEQYQTVQDIVARINAE